MLVLHRKIDESIVISDNIVVTVLYVQGGKVKLGIEAPKQVNIRRGKVNPPEIAVTDSETGE